MVDYTLKAETGFINLSPLGFRRWAQHYWKCRHDFRPPDEGFSPVPYFLLCRVIELQLKALHLETVRQKEVKDSYGHNLVAAYTALDPRCQTLSASQVETLKQASAMYARKGFEYMSVMDAATGFTKAPPLAALDRVAETLMAISAQ